MADFGSALWNKPTSGGMGEGSGGASDPVTRSLRFDGSAYLSRSTGSTSTTWTLSFWVKRATISGPSQQQYFATWAISGSAGEGIAFRGTADSSNLDKIGFWTGSTQHYSTAVYRDPAAWAHICISVNSGTATVYYNGESILSGMTGVQAWGSMRLGAWLNQNELEGLMADVHGVEGHAKSPTDFIELGDYGNYIPKAYTGSFGTNGFHLKLDNSSDIGADDAGSNDFNASGIVPADIREDNPFKNHATWNPLIKRSSTSNIFTYSEGNTVATYTGGVAHTSTTIASTGVHYAEFAFSGGTSSISGAGVVRARWNGGSADSYTTTYGGCYYGSSGNVDSPSGSTSVSAVGSDRLGIAFDGANNKADFYSVTSGGTMTLLKSLTSSDSINFDGSATFTATSHDTGATTITGYFEEGEWYGTAPSVGSTTATALNTSNLSTPTVTPAENFAAAKYEGAGGSEEINLGFTPALTWIKRREDSGYYHGWYDSVRGLSSGALASNDASNEDGTQRVSSFDSDTGSEGFTLSSSHYSYTNTSGKDFISWSWKAHQGGPVTRSHTMTLEVNDLWGNATDWDSTKLEVWEGATKLADISQPAYNGGSSTTYTIKTNDTDKIKVVWDVDSSMDWTAMYAVLKNSSNTTLASWDGSSYYGGSTPADGSNFYIPSGHDSYNAAVTGVVEGPTTVVESYNAAAGFSIITYSGNGSSDGDTQDLTHTLGAEPEFIITKARTDSNGADGGWNVYHKHNVASGSGSHPLQWLHHNWDSYKVTYAPVIPKSGSENTTIQVNNDSGYGHSSNDSGATYVAYAWTPVAGYSHFGLWEASGNNPQFYHLGFRPAFVMLKCVNVNSTNWIAFDSSRETFNQIDHPLFPNTSGDEPTSGWGIDFLSNGFAWRDTSSEGYSGRKYIVCAWAETPEKFANAR